MLNKNKILSILTLITLITAFVPIKGNAQLLSGLETENRSRNWEELPPISIDQLPRMKPLIQYNYSVNWTNQVLVFNESIILNQSTILRIDNCSIEFTPSNLSDMVEIILGSSSQLVINNSVFFQQNDSDVVSNIIFSGHQASIQNSTFINLGRNANRPGLLIQEATSVSVSDSTFIDTYRGLTFKDSMNIVIQNCSFKEFSKEYSEAIRGDRCNNIAIENCTFANMSNTTFGITLKSSTNTNITDCDFKDYGLLGIGIGSDQYYSYNQNITLLGNSFREGLFGIFITGMHVSINENSFNNLQITGMILRGLFIEVLNNSFVDLGRGIVFSSPYYTLVGATNTIVKDNVFTDILNEAILISNYDGVTLFSFETNNITNIGTAFAFEGNLGGESETVRSQITGNIIRNTTNYAITGTYWDNLARLQHIMINLNAFIDCKPDYTSFETDYYYFIDILWDDGIFGNYWGEVNTTSNNDEDSNLINDDFYVINAIHGQVDFAPLLSTRYIFEDDPIGTSHPSDFTRTQKELTVNNTLEWKVNRLRDLTIQIWVNNESSSDYTNTTNSVKFELDKLNDGLHNITLVVSNDTIFRDSVWVTILPPETNLFSDILIPLGTISFIIAIVAVFSYGFLKKRR